MEKIVFLDRDTVIADFRKPEFEHEWIEFGNTAADETQERIKDSTLVITNKVRMTADILAQNPSIKLIAVAATGTDSVDVRYCRENGITVCNVKNYSVHSVPEHTFALILALRRNLIAYNGYTKNGGWSASPIFVGNQFPITELAGRTLGIIGYGSLGKAVGAIAKAFGMNVVIAERKNAENIREGYMDLNEVLSIADVVSLHCPLTDETRGMIGEAELNKMRSDAILINCGRGGLVDEKALADALRNGVIAGAGVDVLSAEPPANGNVLLDPEIPNLIVTPHNAWASREAMQLLADIVIDNLERFIRGEPQNLV